MEAKIGMIHLVRMNVDPSLELVRRVLVNRLKLIVYGSHVC